MHKDDRDAFIRRWSRAIKIIGVPKLLNLSNAEKKVLAETTDLVKKTLLLESIAKHCL